MNNNFNSEEKEEKEYAFKNIIEKNKNSRALSVASLAVGILSVLLFSVPWLGIFLGLVSIVISVIARKILGYFDGIAIAGLIVGIFGVVFGVSGFIFGYMINNPDIKIFLSEIGLL